MGAQDHRGGAGASHQGLDHSAQRCSTDSSRAHTRGYCAVRIVDQSVNIRFAELVVVASGSISPIPYDGRPQLRLGWCTVY